MSRCLSPTSDPLVQLLPLGVLLIIPLSLDRHLLQYPLLVGKQHNVGVQVPPLRFSRPAAVTCSHLLPFFVVVQDWWLDDVLFVVQSVRDVHGLEKGLRGGESL